ncbi:MAG: peptidoglycan-binding domain-containing protein [Syntrophomonas sp.]
MIGKKTALRMTLILIVLITMLGIAQASAAETNLSWGSTGAQVSSLQTTLNTMGYWCGTVDGIFGAKHMQQLFASSRIMECLLQAW